MRYCEAICLKRPLPKTMFGGNRRIDTGKYVERLMKSSNQESAGIESIEIG